MGKSVDLGWVEFGMMGLPNRSKRWTAKSCSRARKSRRDRKFKAGLSPCLGGVRLKVAGQKRVKALR